MPNGRFKSVSAAAGGVLFAPGIGLYDATVSSTGWQSMSVTAFAGLRVRVQVTATAGTTTHGLDFLFSVTAATLPATTTRYATSTARIPMRLTLRENSYVDLVVPSAPGATWIIYRALKGVSTGLRINRI